MNDKDNQRLPLGRIKSIQTPAPEERNAPRAEERFSEGEMEDIRRAFSLRFASLFPGMNKTEIARRLKTTDTVVGNYTDGKRLPTAELLLQVERTTGVNVHWLLTGKGQKRVEFANIFTEAEENEIQKLADLHKRSFLEEVRALTGAMILAIRKLSD